MVQDLTMVARLFPQSAYYAVAVSAQNEWQYVLRTLPGAGAHMGPVESALRDFLSTLLDVQVNETVGQELRQLLACKPKMGGLGIMDPTILAAFAFETSKECCDHLTAALRNCVDVDIEQSFSERGQLDEARLFTHLAHRRRHWTCVIAFDMSARL